MNNNTLTYNLLTNLFKRKEGDTYYEIKNGDLLWVVNNIAKNKMYGFKSNVAETVLKHKKISKKQAEIIPSAVYDK